MMVAMENEIIKELWETLVVIGRSVFEDNIKFFILGWCYWDEPERAPHCVCVCVVRSGTCSI